MKGQMIQALKNHAIANIHLHKTNIDIYSVITYNSLYDDAFETEINMILMDKLFDIRDLENHIDERIKEIPEESIHFNREVHGDFTNK